MTFVKKPFALTVVALAAAALPLIAQVNATRTVTLNPTVTPLASARTAVPAECAETTVPVITERLPADAPSPAASQPAGDVRLALRRVQSAAEDDDYAAFKAALADVRSAAAAYPAARDVLQVYTDLARLWDFSMTSTTGAFFDETDAGGAILASLDRYPDYRRTIAPDLLVRGGQTLYPSRESRQFLTREAGRRLSRMGITTPSRVTERPRETPRPSYREPAPVPAIPREASTPARPRTHTRTTAAITAPKPAPVHRDHTPPKSTTTTTKTARSAPAPKPAPPVRVAEAAKPPVVRHTATPTNTPVPAKPATTTTAPPPAKPAIVTAPPATKGIPPAAPTKTSSTAPVTTSSAPAPVTTSSAPAPVTTTSTPAPVTTSSTPVPVTTSTVPPGTDTTVALSTSDTAATTSAEPAQPAKRNSVNLVLAVILILVGIGVLVVLFRASD